MATITERLNKFITTKGFQEQTSPSVKYRKFFNPHNNQFYWVGRNGAIRKGKNSSDSVSMTDFYKEAMRKEKFV